MNRGGWPPSALERATEADLAQIVDLEQECFPYPWTIQQLRSAILARDMGGVLILRGVEGEGPTLLAYCVFQIVIDEVNVHTLAVAPRYRRRGIGRWMLERVLEVAARQGADTAFLEVRQSNWAALDLYTHLGFDVISSRKGYYEGPREDAFVLRKVGLRRMTDGAPRHP